MPLTPASAQALSGARPPAWRAWILAARPHTLGVTVAPVLAACALAWSERGRWMAGVALLTLLAAMLIQIGTNLLNDVGDFERGADGADRLGPQRATAMGWLRAEQVRRAGFGALGVAFLFGVLLATVGGWPIVWLGLVALLCGWAYTAGPWPIAYSAFGEVFVWVFFGLAAVLGTYFLQTGTLSGAAWMLGHMMGAFASAVMLVNNTRDAASDARAGKRTLAVRLGAHRVPRRYTALVILAHALPFVPSWWPQALGAAAAALPAQVARFGLVSLPLSLLAAWWLALRAVTPQRLRPAIVASIAAAVLHPLALAAALWGWRL